MVNTTWRLHLVAIILVSLLVAGCQNHRPDIGGIRNIDLLAGQVYECRYMSGPLVLDGVLDETAWHQAQQIRRFQLYRPRGTYPHTTIGMLAWDDQYLYVAFECTDDDIRSASTIHDDYLAAGDVVELYIKFNDGHPQYYEFVCAPNGTTFDARWPYRGAGNYMNWTPWESGMRTATFVRGTPDQSDDIDEGFTVEMMIPWESFDGRKTPPKLGTVWTFGLFRYDYSVRFEEAYLTMSLAESPEHGFHYYEAYHSIKFAGH